MSNDLQEETSLLCPKLDVVFQALFGEVGSEAITTKFLEAILEVITLSYEEIIRKIS